VRIGVAISDETAYLARPLGNIKNDERLERMLRELAAKEPFDAIVVGDPLNMDGTKNPQTKHADELAGKLRTYFPDKELVMWDERLSSWEANNLMIEANLSRKKRKKKVDGLAAVLILQGYLDHLRARKK
jgi:putative Holliday junction resolvase